LREREERLTPLGVGEHWRVVAFSESVQAQLMQLRYGDAISVLGRLQIDECEKDGVNRISLGLVADNILALRQPNAQQGKDAEVDDAAL
jgi:single-stranded DNA-binding protein